MSVDHWARREAKDFNDAADEDFSRGVESAFGVDEDSFSMGAAHAFDALLSDEAVEAAEDEQYRHGRDLVFGGGCACGEPFPLTRQGIRAHDVHVVRAALQAAIDAVTKEARSD